MVRPLPVTLLTGFLGAGKTTLLKQLLAAPHGLQIGVVLNEFGQAGIDVLPAAEQAYLEIAEGCACCVRNPDLVAAMQELGGRGDLDRAILETSGLADPLPLTWTLGRPELDGLVRLDAVITVVDACNVERARSEEWEAQVRSADVVVLSKRDVASEAQVRAAESAVRDVNPQARLVEVGPGLPVGVLLDVELATPRAQGLSAARARHSDFRGVTFATRARYSLNALEDFLEQMPVEIFRAKGIVPVEEGRWMAFQAVGGRVQVDVDAPAPAHGEARLAFFGRGLEEAGVRPLVEACRLAG